MYGARLSRWAGRRATRKLIKDVRLVNILSGDACSPLGLEEFEAYVALQEHSLENLQFIIWYHDYQQRFFSLDTQEQALSPSLAKYEAHLVLPAPNTKAPIPDSPRSSGWALSPISSSPTTTSWSSWSPISVPSPIAVPLKDQPFRNEILQIVRDRYCVHPNFLDHRNIYHMLYSRQPRSKRSIRLVSVPFAVLGCMQIYSAWRGFCSQVFGRSARQLRAWELVDPADAGVSFQITDPVPSLPPKPPPLRTVLDIAAGTKKHVVAPFVNLPSTSSLEMVSMTPTIGSPSPSGPRIVFTDPEPRGRGGGRAAFRRPAVYGPERVVEDPRIREFHQGVIRDMLWVGFGWGLAWTGIVVGIPGRGESLGSFRITVEREDLSPVICLYG
ncbi:regulator of G protein signaling domain protein [Rhizoctonia solani]|uniref:Regulator of G protein signaling domain protein n=1 Tax=Rhizoctonia solani TaxID=456999 RepID=A0A8H8SSA1_9AGAM|nr:regulator of G protein signaling domain protein [Rhizoctonia solani]QRW16586.1 regulator of G protein signaling domain protein [Rhizoctonia solani]